MSVAVYKEIPLSLDDGNQKRLFKLKLNLYTGSVRLEGGAIKRSIFLGRKMFNRLFQFMRNEYGFTLGRILYKDRFMRNGHATTSANEHFRFTVQDETDIKVVVENEDFPAERFTAIVPKTDATPESDILIPSVLAALIYRRDNDAAA